MRDGDSKTPARKSQPKVNTPRESSGKKMVQARLPFKVITSVLTSPSSVSSSSATVVSVETAATVNRRHSTGDTFDYESACQDTRKRRLSYEEENEVINFPSSVRQENPTSASVKKLKSLVTPPEDDIIMLTDSEDEVTYDGPQVKGAKVKSTPCSSPKTPIPSSKSAPAPKSAGSSGSRTQVRKDGPRVNTPKLQIKLSLSNKKRRKSKQKPIIEKKGSATEIVTESSDDTEIIVCELNPHKRPRVDEAENGVEKIQSFINNTEKEERRITSEKEATEEKMSDNSTDEERGREEMPSELTIILNSDSNDSNTMSFDEKSSELISKSVQRPSSESDSMEDAYVVVQDLLYEIIDKSLEEVLRDPLSKSPANTPARVLTPKQQMLKEKRRTLREIKENKLREEKLQKHREKVEKEQVKQRERDEKEEQKRKEREERDEQKRKEREEKERKRLAEIEAKNEEKRKRNEAKEEELRKKEEERKRKEQEKMEAENKKKKAAEAFTKFFVPKTTRSDGVVEAHQLQAANNVANDGRSSESVDTLAFRPFQIKGDMKLAPVCRKMLTNNARIKLDSFVCEKTQDSANDRISNPQLYLNELMTGEVIPVKWRCIIIDKKEESGDDDDVVCIDELESAQTIVEDAGRPLERYRAKFYKFYENRRPPYFGTWRKKTTVITPRCPFALDKKFFDYDVDSDLEWEEEEPGESLGGSDDEKEKESEDDDYEVDNEWFVPHGHLSEEELQDDDENGVSEGGNREVQKAKLKMLQNEFAQEMKRKTEKIKPRLVGCIWQDQYGNKPESCPAVIWENLNKHAMLYTTPLVIEEPAGLAVGEVSEESTSANATATTGEKLKPISLSEPMLKDLIRLIHGNRHSKAFLIKEFIAHIEKTEEAIKNGDVRGPLKSVVRDKIEEFAVWQVTDLNSIKGKSKKIKKKLCWLVCETALRKYDLNHLELHNKWSYTLPPKFIDTHSESSQTLVKRTEVEDVIRSATSNNKELLPSALGEGLVPNKTEGIKMFTKVLTAGDNGQKLDVIAEDSVKEKTSKKEPSKIQINTLAPFGIPKQINQIKKKRVPLLMSTARGQQIPTSEKNALISQFLKKSKEEKDSEEKKVQENATETEPEVQEVDGIVVLD